MALGSRRHLHPKFFSLASRPLELFCNSEVEIFIDGRPVKHEFDEATGGLKRVEGTPIWKGRASITPNKDWRARNREWGHEYTGVHAYRIQLEHLDKNEMMPRDQWGDPDLRVDFHSGMRVVVTWAAGDSRVDDYHLVIRNAQTDDMMWQQTLLCDVDTGDLHG